MKCKDCKFFVKYNVLDPNRGCCKRFPPIRNSNMWSNPAVDFNDWCGEFVQQITFVEAKK